MIRNWEEHRCMTRRAKAVAIVSMLVAGGFSVFFAVEQLWLKLFGAVLLGIGGSVVLSIKTCEECNK